MRKKNIPNTNTNTNIQKVDASVQKDLTLEEIDTIIKWMNNTHNLNLKLIKSEEDQINAIINVDETNDTSTMNNLNNHINHNTLSSPNSPNSPNSPTNPSNPNYEIKNELNKIKKENSEVLVNDKIEKIEKIEKIKKKIEYLESVYQPEQRTDEWYQHRHGLITASSVWKVFGSQSTQNQLIYEKCSPIDVEKYNKVNTESPLHWGQKYEQLSKDLYEMLNHTKIQEFGCIKHPDPAYYFIGASPDGINVCPSSHLYGRMLEIKNVVSREITGIPKEDYWIQMQIQMEVCRLPECDFLETKFVEYEDECAFDADSNTENDETKWNYNLKGERRGVIVYFIKGDKPYYQYAPLEITTKSQFENWLEKTIDAHDGITWIKNIYWHLEVYSCVLVLRDKEWFKNAVVKIQELWKIVEREKITGYEHRAPKRRVIKKNDKIDKNNKNETVQAQTKIKFNDDGTFVPTSLINDETNTATKNICHSGLFFDNNTVNTINSCDT
jgi:putative phage-type endonuclease